MLLRVGQQMLLLYPALSRISFKQLLRKIHPHVTGIRPNLVLRRKWNTFENKEVSLKDHMRAGASDPRLLRLFDYVFIYLLMCLFVCFLYCPYDPCKLVFLVFEERRHVSVVGQELHELSFTSSCSLACVSCPGQWRPVP
jgi:hypothetical protein